MAEVGPASAAQHFAQLQTVAITSEEESSNRRYLKPCRFGPLPKCDFVTNEGVTEAVLSIGISGMGSQLAVGDDPGGRLASSGLAGAEHASTGRTHSLRRRPVGIDQLSNRRRRWRPTMPTTLESIVTK